MLRRAVLVFCLVAPSLQAWAAPATPEEAARLKGLFETYLGKPADGASPGVTVTPVGEDYLAAFDLQRLAAPLHAFGVDVVATEPYRTTLTPLSDGTWRVRRGPFPQFGFTTKKGLTYSVQLSSKGSDAIFDPKIESFVHMDNDVSGNRTSVTMDGHSQRTELTESGKQVIDSKGASPDDVTSTLHQDDKDIRYSSRTEPAPADDPMGDIAVAVASAHSEATLAHQRGSALLDLWAFLVAHPARDQLVAEQTKLKSLATALVPYATSLDSRVHADSFAAKTAQGGAKAASFDQTLAFGGDGSDGVLALSLAIKGFDLAPSKPLPSWVAAMIPTSMEIVLATTKLDLGKAVRVLIDGADLSRDEIFPSAVVAKATAALSESGNPGVVIKPSTIANKTLQIALAGAFASSGAGKLKIEANGLDDEIALIGRGAADDPMAAQAVQMLALAKAFAAPASDGRLEWDIVTGPDGTTVNGKALQ